MTKIKIVDARYSDTTPNSRLTEVISSYEGFRRGITCNNYPRFMDQVYKRTQFFFDHHHDKKDTTSARLDLVERGIFCMEDVPMCIICSENPIMPLRAGGLSSCCSKSCAASLSSKNSEQTNMARRGVRHHALDPEVRKKTLDTLRDRYNGAECPLDVPEFVEKARRTHFERRGVNHHMKICDVVNGIVEKNIKNPNSPLNPNFHEKRRLEDSINGKSQYIRDEFAWGILNDADELGRLIESTSLNDIASLLNVSRATILRYANIHDIEFDRYRFGNRSSAEIQVENFIKTIYHENVISGYRGIDKSCEIDIYLPDIKIGFEYNGLYWHSRNPQTIDKFDKNKHLKKTNAANREGIRLIHIFEDEWIHRTEQVKEKIKSIICIRGEAVHGRKTVPFQVDAVEARDFLNQNHIQGSCRAFFYGGLYHEGDLVAVMAFGKTRSGIELVRYATSCKVHGGFSKLLKFFKTKHPEVHKIVSFADRRWSVGDVYEKNGFVLDSILPPDYRYVVGDQRIHKSNYRKDRMAKIFDRYDPSLSERDNAWNHRIYPIYDCGLLKYVKEL